MSFRSRLITFFVVIVVLPTIALGLLSLRLIDRKGDEASDRAARLAATAAVIYRGAEHSARVEAAIIAPRLRSVRGAALRRRVASLVGRGPLRLTIRVGGRLVLDWGARSAIAPGSAQLASPHALPVVVTISELDARAYSRELLAPDVAVLVRGGTRTLSATPPELRTLRLRAGDKTMVAAGYRFTTERFQGFGDSIVLVGIGVRLGGSSSWLSGAAASLVFVGSFIVLAAAFVLLASRTLGRQLELFLQVARRLGKGELSARVPVEGHDEFAALARELNRMSDQLASRIDELGSERVKLRESIRRIGQTFAANLDRQALLELALRTAIDAVGASCGRLSARSGASQLLAEVARVGSFGGFHEQILTAEREALESGGLAESDRGGRRAAAVALGPFEPEGRAHALITVGREGEPFTEDDREVLRSLASEATLALENVELHFQVQRQASTDELTRLANHRQFQELLTRELDEARRYRHPVALIMVDIDDFKTINDTYGHPQGDVVLRDVGRILRQNSREVDVAARYGGEEMALILPHTDLEGAYAIAERVRGAVEGLRTPRLDERGELQITISAGVAATVDATKDTLIAEADAALYAAKRQGKNQTVKAGSQTQEVLRAE